MFNFESLADKNALATIIALLNGKGGTLFGASFDVDVNDYILPDPRRFITINTITNEIVIKPGVEKPYYLKETGLIPQGVFIIKNDQLINATHYDICSLIINNVNIYLNIICENQNLTFNSLTQYSFNIPNEYLRNQELYNNLAQILSDQNISKVKIINNIVMKKEVKEFQGSIIKQFHEVIDYIHPFNKSRLIFEGTIQSVFYDYYPYIIKESILNALIHRDYSLTNDIIITINENEIEIFSPGGLFKALTIKDLLNGLIECRNQHLYNFFKINNLVSNEHGIKKIYENYKGFLQKPQIITSENSFILKLPKQTYQNLNFTSKALIIDLLADKGNLSIEDICQHLQINLTKIYLMIEELKADQLITTKKIGRKNYYSLINS